MTPEDTYRVGIICQNNGAQLIQGYGSLLESSTVKKSIVDNRNTYGLSAYKLSQFL